MDLLKKSNATECLLEIERQRLYEMADQYGDIWNPNVIKQSMILDEIINNYNKIYHKMNIDKKHKNPI
ncbi:aspartyl-phosphate phosphatase Spo0E family protein [Paenibacillus sp. KQZ6P-2]|uniref:Aspartyl-phosphate phosphatase Spo0E family protein n=1 Tax=Paenibacillus mangrovi TaxID=2931978 RepID=A0A9X2B0H9_9BACL|nr:aspartyl-phosphate phosphatase Spo0E family protein [Paenibacillus mangrovi]MCJ8010231.1 aspartyl-phosphate phosphatase Spo0E family protein [Paenibacillus mangrovi]